MKRGVVFFFFFLGLCCVSARVGNFNLHDESEFYLSIDGTDYSLKQAIDDGLRRGGHSYGEPSSLFGQSHSANDIWVSTDFGEMGLIDALSSQGICKMSLTDSYSSVPSENVYHFASDVDSGDLTFQELVDSGDLARVDGGWSSWSSWSTCSASSHDSGTQFRTRTCNNPSKYCGGDSCSGSSTDFRTCNPNCVYSSRVCHDGKVWNVDSCGFRYEIYDACDYTNTRWWVRGYKWTGPWYNRKCKEKLKEYDIYEYCKNGECEQDKKATGNSKTGSKVSSFNCIF